MQTSSLTYNQVESFRCDSFRPHIRGYRFGFNGKEKTDEWNGEGNIYDYGFRIYDPRICRFLSVDPLFAGYPYYTPYQFAGNKPTRASDLDGLEEDLDPWTEEMINPACIFQRGADGVGFAILNNLWSPKLRGKEIRNWLQFNHFAVAPNLTDEDLDANFTLTKEDGMYMVYPKFSTGQMLLTYVTSAIDIAALFTPSKNGGAFIISNVSPIVARTVSTIIGALNRAKRVEQITKEWIDIGRGSLYKLADAEAGAILEEAFGLIKPATKESGGDFIFTTGKYANKSVDIMTMISHSAFDVDNFIKQLDIHISKADMTAIDVRGANYSDMQKVYEHIVKNYSKELEAGKFLIVQ